MSSQAGGPQITQDPNTPPDQAAENTFTPSGFKFEGPEQQPEDPAGAEAQIEEALNSLPDDRKELLVPYLTPDFAEVIGELFGDPYYNVFMKMADPNKILIPTDVSATEGTKSSQETPPDLTQSEEATPPSSMDPSVK